MRIKYTLQRMFKNPRFYLYGVGVIIILIAVISFSMAMFTANIEKAGALNITTGNLYPYLESDSFTEGTTEITLAAGETIETTLIMSNINSISAKFNLYYSSSSVDANAYYKGTPTPQDGGIVLPAYNEAGYTNTYNIILINESSSTQTITLGSNTGLDYNELPLPNGVFLIGPEPSTACLDLPDHGGTPNAPEMVGDMIPVVYDETQDEWLKADTTKEWYNYNTQEWANAVTVTQTNRATLVASAVGTVIPMDDINAMFVWIPRYSYTIKDTYGIQGCGGDTATINTPGAFDIRWVESSVTDLGTAAYTGDTVAEWYTNSAFCWGNTCDDPATRNDAGNRELTGIWVGKFETSTTGGVETNEIQQPIIKPTVTSWRNVNISNMFYSVQQYMNSTNGENIFGLSGATYDTHMMKNTEWGAVAYLSQSKYGKYGNTDYIGPDKEIAINNCEASITGIGADAVNTSSSSGTCTTNTYETEKGQTASTTGNIYGIYDISGGSEEYTMGNMQNSSGDFYSANSGFSSPPESKYYNSYPYNSLSSSYSHSILGDALEETAGFYKDYKYYFHKTYPWAQRSANFAQQTNAGAFAIITYYDGKEVSNNSFRITIIS